VSCTAWSIIIADTGLLFDEKCKGDYMDKIIIKNLKVFSYHGVFAEEKREGQFFYVTAELYFNMRKAGLSDSLADTLNYDEAAHVIYNVMTEEKYDLIEAAAENVAASLLLKFDILHKVKIRIDKPDAPVDLTFDSMSVEIERKKHTAYLSIGSNMGDREGYLNFAVDQLGKDEYIRVTEVSDFIETEPYGPVEQPNFMNAALKVETLYDPDELLSVVNDIEHEAGRKRIVHWGPRTLDIDILLYDDCVINTERLTIPHKEMAKREFVLKPMSEIAPYVIHPVLGKDMKELLSELE